LDRVYVVFLESIGLPLPGEAILVSAAIFAGTTQELSIALVVFSAVLGAIFGSIIGFWIGGRYGYPLLLRYGSYIGLTETRIKIAQYLFRRQGMVVVLALSLCCDRSSGSLREQTGCRSRTS
jgi:membrane protein DedA with SNARE-associated domain